MSSNNGWSNKEVVNQHHFALDGQVASVFDTYDWQHGYVWAFNMVIKTTDALAEHENANSWIHYPMQHALEYGGTKLLAQQDPSLALQLIQYIDKFQIPVESNTDLATDCIRGSSTVKNRFIERMIQHALTNRQAELQQEALEIESTENKGDKDATMTG